MSKVWFTSDTHFGSQRTLELSRRPFKNVEEMDKALIENWNSIVNEKDIVYHIGDFGNYDIVKKLNGKIRLVAGNYECSDANGDYEIMRRKLIDKGFNGVTFNRLNFVTEDNVYYMLHHKPSDRNHLPEIDWDCVRNDNEVFSLFGHIHKLQMVKRFGLNVGVDCHNFKPIDLETVKFYRNAILNHYDEDVFMHEQKDIHELYL